MKKITYLVCLIIFVFGMVLVRQSPATAKGMVFFTLEDEVGFINLVFTPQIYQRYRMIINQQSFLLAEGKIQTSNEGHSVMVKRVINPVVEEAEIVSLPQTMQRHLRAMKKTGQTMARSRNYM